MADEIMRARQRNRSVWIIGNGGSASTAEHFETDLSFVRDRNLEILPNVNSLTSNSALVTATSNDVSFQELFKVMLTRKAQSGDLLIAISASGNSPNILNALTLAKALRLRTFSLLGFDGGESVTQSDDAILVLTEVGEYGIVEDIHLSICHAVSARIREELAN